MIRGLLTDSQSGMSPDSLSPTESDNSVNQLSSESEDSSISLDHNHRNHKSKAHGYFNLSFESRYSDTNSLNLDDDTQHSWSHGTSDREDKPSAVSTQSFILAQPRNFFANSNDDQSIGIRSVSD